jgi:hypothetical protein
MREGVMEGRREGEKERRRGGEKEHCLVMYKTP